MNYSAKDYAKSFCDVVLARKAEADSKKHISSFLDLVKRNRDQGKLRNILLFVEKIFYQNTSYRKLIIESAREVNKENEKIINSLVKKTDKVIKAIDPRLIAGVKITINDELQFDGSLAKKIKNILKV